MLPELIYREEKSNDYRWLIVLGGLSGLVGYTAASFLFPSVSDILAVIFGAIPLVYPLTREFLEDEEDKRPHIPEIKTYAALFLGELFAFFLLGLTFPGVFQLQNSVFAGTGFATFTGSFLSILFHNFMVFLAIFAISTVIGSAGAFMLTWNASVMGVFFAKLVASIESTGGYFTCSPTPSPICYMPHATFEMTGFIVAGIAGSLVSAALYREHFDTDTWMDYGKLIALGVVLIILAAFLETA
ncbi:MAG: stage II sporulation protein M [Candidatus Nanohaloarchaea archaeon]